jgi:hypothetical protein
MPAPTVQELKKALTRAGFEVYRTRGEEVHLAERPRENLIMDSGVVVAASEPLRIRFVVRAQKADFQGEDEAALLGRARSLGSAAAERGFVEHVTRTRSVLDPGDASHVLDTWYEVGFEKTADTLEDAVEDVRFIMKLEKAAAR